MLTINTNLSSLLAQFNTKTSTNQLNLAIERMTTGYKINHAKDNAANYSISTNMSTKIGGLQVAEENALQGIEMMSTMSENLSLIEDKLTRMRALAVQTQNGTYAGQSLAAISAEAESLFSEINRINEGATFNGIKLFNTGKAEVTNAGKELELNEQGFLQEVIRVDTTGMTALSSMADDATLAVGEYTISNVDELLQLQKMANSGLVESGSTFVLTHDIDLDEYCKVHESEGGWIPIGNTTTFNCTFEGNGHTISGLSCSRSGSYKGLFGMAYNSVIRNLRISNASINNCYAHSGILVGDGQGSTIYNCSIINSKINATGHNIAAFVGSSYRTGIQYCYFEGSVSGTDAVGGISGRGFLNNCYVKGNVKATTGTAGGICASPDSIKACKSSANVTAAGNAGGISGGAYAGSECYADGIIYGKNRAGGLFGSVYNTSKIENSIFEGSVYSDGVFGIICGSSSHTLTLENCYYYDKTLGIDLVGDATNITIKNEIDMKIPTDYTLQIGTGSDESTSTVSCTTYIDFGGLKTLLDGGIESVGSIQKIDDLLNVVSLKQTELGMMENRLMSVLDEINIKYDNLVSSRSTIRDADIAEVSAHYIQQQILQQASATLMATANQSPAIALQLI